MFSFALRVTRKIKHDATFSLENILYEADQHFAGTCLEVRYEPGWLNNPARP
ncbi:MAG: Mu transposase C-terminal domain-containing protein [Firmicutes bacterium]|nr:Mu transposase C-terminal domain-containing protein [Bacillota bacterium]